MYLNLSLKDMYAYLFASSAHTPLKLFEVAYVTQDAGPQIPSDVTNLVKVGPNVLQAIGEFTGNWSVTCHVQETR